MEAFGELLGALLAGAAGLFLGFAGSWLIRFLFLPIDRWRVRTCAWIGLGLSGVFFGVAPVGQMLIHMFDDTCGTSDVTEVQAPDHRHKVVVYNFDCGATTSFQLVVSLLPSDQSLAPHNMADPLYRHNPQKPVAEGPAKNFEVTWSDATHANVRVRELEGGPKSEVRDGVTVEIEALP